MFYGIGRFIRVLRGGAAAHKKMRGQGPPGPPNPLPLADRTQLAPRRANMRQGRQGPAARSRSRPMNVPLAAALSTWEKAPRSGVLSTWVLYSDKTTATGWFIGCFIEIKHLVVVAGVLLKALALASLVGRGTSKQIAGGYWL